MRVVQSEALSELARGTMNTSSRISTLGPPFRSIGTSFGVFQYGLRLILLLLFVVPACKSVPDQRPIQLDWPGHRALRPPTTILNLGDIVSLDADDQPQIHASAVAEQLNVPMTGGPTIDRDQGVSRRYRLGVSIGLPKPLYAGATASGAQSVSLITRQNEINVLTVAPFAQDALPILDNKYANELIELANAGKLHVVTSLWTCREFALHFFNDSDQDISAAVKPDGNTSIAWGGAEASQHANGAWVFRAPGEAAISVAFNVIPLRATAGHLELALASEGEQEHEGRRRVEQMFHDAIADGAAAWAFDEMIAAADAVEVCRSSAPLPDQRVRAAAVRHAKERLNAVQARATDARRTRDTLWRDALSQNDPDAQLAIVDRILSLNPHDAEALQLRRQCLLASSPRLLEFVERAESDFKAIQKPTAIPEFETTNTEALRIVAFVTTPNDGALESLIEAYLASRQFDLAFLLAQSAHPSFTKIKRCATQMERLDGVGSSYSVVRTSIKAATGSLRERVDHWRDLARLQVEIGDRHGAEVTFDYCAEVVAASLSNHESDPDRDAVHEVLEWAYELRRADVALRTASLLPERPPAQRVNYDSFAFAHTAYTASIFARADQPKPWTAYVENASERSAGLYAVATKCIETGQLQVASEAADQVADPLLWDLVHAWLATAQRQRGSVDEVARSLGRIRNPAIRWIQAADDLGANPDLSDDQVNDHLQPLMAWPDPVTKLWSSYCLARRGRFHLAARLARSIQDAGPAYLGLVAVAELAAPKESRINKLKYSSDDCR